MIFPKDDAILIKLSKMIAWHLGVAQMVARYLGVVEAAGSNPVTQTKRKRTSKDVLFSLYDLR